MEVLYRAIDEAGNMVEFLLRDEAGQGSARRYLERTIDQNGAHDTVDIDKNGANLAGVYLVSAGRKTLTWVPQAK